MIVSDQKTRVKLPRAKCNRLLLPNVDRSMALVDRALVDVLRKLVDGDAAWPLFLYGPAGGGKTLAALSLCDQIKTAAYYTAGGLCDTTMELKNVPGALRKFWDTVESMHLVVLDELATRVEANDFAYEMVKKFLDARELHARCVAIYASNVEPGKLAQLYDDRVASRCLRGTVFQLRARDRRLAP